MTAPPAASSDSTGQEKLGRRKEAMGHQSPIYAFVSRGTVVLAEYSDFTGNFTITAPQSLLELPATIKMLTCNSHGLTFDYLVEDGIMYCVVAVESVGQATPIPFLVQIREDFRKRYGGGKAATVESDKGRLNREFGSKLEEPTQFCADHPEEIFRSIMLKNLTALDCGENIELLVDMAKNPASQAKDLRKQRTQERRKTWLQNMFY